MKKQISILVLCLIVFSSLSVFAAAESIIINGQEAVIPSNMGSIKEMDDRTFVPVRFVMENLGCNVQYLEEDRTAVISSIACTYIIQEGNNTLYVLPDQYTETQNIVMDTAAFIDEAESRMYVPIRFLAEAIGYDVGWNEETQTVTLDIKK